jgi:hypothetical protein
MVLFLLSVWAWETVYRKGWAQASKRQNNADDCPRQEEKNDQSLAPVGTITSFSTRQGSSA